MALSKAPAKRSIFFITDGTKADAFLGYNTSHKVSAPFIRSIVEERGSYGVSYTALPTESKICTTSMMSGYYLDLPDLVNLYFFDRAISDHLINQSTWAWSFGNEDVISLFHSTGRDSVTISPVDENYDRNLACPNNKRAIEMLEDLFSRAGEDKDLDEKLRSDKIMIFIHLICVDMIGHIHKPFSPEYFEQIYMTDKLLENATGYIANFYKDDSTAFYVTSDHGMKSTGVHADDSPDNIRTPFVAWGAGIAGPAKGPKSAKTHDDYSQSWGLKQYERKDIRQIDIAPLVASVMGIAIPVNSEGVVPLGYLEDGNEHFKAESIFVNAKQICSAYMRREEEWMEHSVLSGFTKGESLEIRESLNDIHTQLNDKNYEKVIRSSKALIDRCSDGVTDYKDSEKSGLLVIFSSAFLGWMSFGFVTALIKSDSDLDKIRQKSRTPMFVWGALTSTLVVFLWIKNSPWRYYVYSLLPIYFFYEVFNNFSKIKAFAKRITAQGAVWVLLLALTIPLMAVAFKGEKYLLMIFVFTWGLIMAFENYTGTRTFMPWMASISALAFILSFNKIELPEVDIWAYSWVLLTAVNFAGTYYFRHEALRPLLTISLITLGSGWLSYKADFPTVSEREFWLSVEHDIAKISLPLAMVYPFVFKSQYQPRLTLLLYLVFAAFSPLIVFQAISYEIFFFLAFIATLFTWMKLEQAKNKDSVVASQRNAIIILVGFQVLYHISYYGIGNHATIDSFKLEAGFRLLDGFNVPRLGLLMILKFATPFFILSLFFQAMVKQNFPEKSGLNVVLFAVSTCAVIIFNYFNTTQGDMYHPQLTISFPILTACILTGNVAVSGYANLLLKNIDMEYDGDKTGERSSL